LRPAPGKYASAAAAAADRLHAGVDVWGGTVLLERSNGAALLFRRQSYVVGLLSSVRTSTPCRLVCLHLPTTVFHLLGSLLYD